MVALRATVLISPKLCIFRTTHVTIGCSHMVIKKLQLLQRKPHPLHGVRRLVYHTYQLCPGCHEALSWRLADRRTFHQHIWYFPSNYSKRHFLSLKTANDTVLFKYQVSLHIRVQLLRV
ncbi:hypothetical protein M3J09_009341 [Ascochyta lentis]